jgi:hypothetical protein
VRGIRHTEYAGPLKGTMLISVVIFTVVIFTVVIFTVVIFTVVIFTVVIFTVVIFTVVIFIAVCKKLYSPFSILIRYLQIYLALR